MGTLFAGDDLFRVPWSSFGFHGAPVLLRPRPIAAATTRDHPKPLLRTGLSAFTTSPAAPTDGLSPLGHVLAKRAATPSLMPRQTSYPTPEPPDLTMPGAMRSTDISPARAKEIQTALVQFGYLNAPTRSWDATSVAAMRRLQSDHHWQTKFAPDARALILLGLGPGSAAP